MTTEPNVTELDALLAWAETENDKRRAGLASEWDQSQWATDYSTARVKPPVPSCGSACCLAGKAVAWAGGRFIMEPEKGYAYEAEMPDGATVSIDDFAREELGLTEDQADALFYSDNSIEDVRRIIAAIKDGDLHPMFPEHPDYEWER